MLQRKFSGGSRRTFPGGIHDQNQCVVLVAILLTATAATAQQLEHIDSLTFTGRHLMQWGELDYRLLSADSHQTDPLTMTTTFRQSNVNFAPT